MDLSLDRLLNEWMMNETTDWHCGHIGMLPHDNIAHGIQKYRYIHDLSSHQTANSYAPSVLQLLLSKQKLTNVYCSLYLVDVHN